jgi:prepilin-type N-terminal cleavage/methylation domain-containing protein
MQTITAIKGFTLAELLISLLIIAEIATFTIPKILTSQQNGSYNAIAKDDIAMVAGTFQQAQMAGLVSSGTTMGALTQYMNYVTYDTGRVLDDVNGSGSLVCSSTYPCLILHNGSAFQYEAGASFSGTSTTNAIWFHIDPDSLYSGTTNGTGKAVGIFLYFNGRMSDEGSIASGTRNSVQSYTANSNKVPFWFSW